MAIDLQNISRLPKALQDPVGELYEFGRDFVEEMIATKSNPIKLYKADYEDMLEEFNEQIKHHENRLR